MLPAVADTIQMSADDDMSPLPGDDDVALKMLNLQGPGTNTCLCNLNN